MTSSFKGGCACGAVRYASDAEPAFSLICQCRQCQRISGSGHAAQFALPSETVSLTGEVKFFGLTSDDGNAVSSGFCLNCGSPVPLANSLTTVFPCVLRKPLWQPRSWPWPRNI